MLAQQHAERGRRGRVFECLLRKAHAGRAAARRHQQAVVFPCGCACAALPHRAWVQIFCRCAHPPAFCFQLARRRSKSGIQCHILFSLIALPRPLFPAGQAGMFSPPGPCHPAPVRPLHCASAHSMGAKAALFFIPGRLRAEAPLAFAALHSGLQHAKGLGIRFALQHGQAGECDAKAPCKHRHNHTLGGVVGAHHTGEPASRASNA